MAHPFPMLGRSLVLLVCTVLTPQAVAQIAGGTSTAASVDAMQVLRVALTLAGIVALFLASTWLARRANRFTSRTADGVRVVGGVSLGAREKLVLVEISGRRLLVGVAPGRVNMISDLGDASTDAVSKEADDGFEQCLDRSLAEVAR